MSQDITQQAVKAGDALASVPIDQMLLNLAKGVAWGQFDLDKVGMDVTKLMGVPGQVNIGPDRISMLEAGFLPTFYQFVDLMLELKMEIKIRNEERRTRGNEARSSFSRASERYRETSASASAGLFGLGASGSSKSGRRNKTTSAYGRTITSRDVQTYGHELSASSLMRAKMVPKPAPDVLVERIRALVKQLRAEATPDDGQTLTAEQDQAFFDDLFTDLFPEGFGE